MAKWFGSGPSAIPTTDPGTSPREQYRRRATAQGTIAGAERRCPVPWHESRAPGKEHGIVGPGQDNQRGQRPGIGTRAATARGQAATCPMERECPRFAAASRRPPLANASDRQGLQAETYCCRRGTGLLRNAKAFSDVCNCRESGPLHSYISLLQGNV